MGNEIYEISANASTIGTGWREQESERKRAHLLQIAREQFVREGYRAATMGSIALSAGISKRTLYLWHADKAALFRACIEEGARRFPLPALGHRADVAETLERFARSLIEEFSTPSSVGMGALLLREQQEFPELLPTAERSRDIYLVQPLAAYLRDYRLERPGSTERARLFLSMALAQVHDHLMLGVPLPSKAIVDRHAALTVRVFLNGAQAGCDGGAIASSTS